MKGVPVEMCVCRWLWMCAMVVVVSAIALSCASAPAQAPDATATPTAAPSEEQAPDPEPTPIPTATPGAASAPRANAEATPSPSPTATPAVSEEPASAPEPAATSTDQAVDDDSPLGDCFGGVLSEDPMHCYVLEQAQAQGLIDILGMYEDPYVDLLHVSIRQAELSPELFRFFRINSHAFAETWPELVPKKKYGRYMVFLCDIFPICYLRTGWLVDHDPEVILPYSSEHGRIVPIPGGESGRRQVPGWGSWRQVWPAVASGTSGASGASGTFDVSDVDMSNLPSATSEFGFTGSHGGGGG